MASETSGFDALAMRLVMANQRRRRGWRTVLLRSLLSVEVQPGVVFEPGARLLHVGQGHVLTNRIARVGSGTQVGPHTALGAPKHPDHTSDCGLIDIGSDVFIAPGVVMVAPSAGQVLTIGDRAVIAAHSVVMTDVSAGDVVAGSPARRISRR